MNQEYQDKIDKYLLGQMSDTESLNFEKEMAEDKDFMLMSSRIMFQLLLNQFFLRPESIDFD